MFVFVSLLAALMAAPVDVSPVQVQPKTEGRASIPVGAVGVVDPDRISCKREAVVGSRRQRKICDTSSGWARREEEAAQAMDPGRRSTGDVKRNN